jgi:3-deoxy-D-manno-octulosonic acid (KDO) 8-phosphate synthase
VDGLFIETHFDPANAKSDGAKVRSSHLEGFDDEAGRDPQDHQLI